MPDHLIISNTPEYFRLRATEYREMAKTAGMRAIGIGLLRLAEHFDALADECEAASERK